MSQVVAFVYVTMAQPTVTGHMMSVTAADLDMQNSFYKDEIINGISETEYLKYFIATNRNNIMLSSQSESIHYI